LAAATGLRKLEGVARRWRGEALLAERAYAEAQAELSRAAALARDTGRVRLLMDAEVALARLSTAQGQDDAARRDRAAAHAIAQAVDASLVSSELEGQVRISENAG
jgi:hypothetical protein